MFHIFNAPQVITLFLEQTVTESSRTKLEQERLQELRRLADEIDQNGKAS